MYGSNTFNYSKQIIAKPGDPEGTR